MIPDNPPPRKVSSWKFVLAFSVVVGLGLAALHIALEPGGSGGSDGSAAAPSADAYVSTAEHDAELRTFVNDVLTFTLLHEMGHIIFKQYDVPVGSSDTNESAADGLAAAVMTKGVGSGPGAQHNGLASAALFLDSLHALQLANNRGQYDWMDVHGPSRQRAYKLACLLYGSNPQAFAGIAVRFNLESHRAECVADAADNQRDWGKVISLNLDPGAGKLADEWSPHVAVLYRKIPAGLADSVFVLLSRYRQIAMDEKALDHIGNDLLLLRTPPNIIVQLAQSSNNANRWRERLHQSLSLADQSIDHPADGDPLFAYNYTVVGDSCMDKNNNPTANAFANTDDHSITLCYALVGLIETLGKSLLAESK